VQELVAGAPVSWQAELSLPAAHGLKHAAQLPPQMDLDKLHLTEAKKRELSSCPCLLGTGHTSYMPVPHHWPEKGSAASSDVEV